MHRYARVNTGILLQRPLANMPVIFMKVSCSVLVIAASHAR